MSTQISEPQPDAIVHYRGSTYRYVRTEPNHKGEPAWRLRARPGGGYVRPPAELFVWRGSAWFDRRELQGVDNG